MRRTYKYMIVLLIVSFGTILLMAQPAQKRRAFCGFNIRQGYYYQDKTLEYIVREGKAGDKSGIPDVVTKIKEQLSMDVDIAVYIAKAEDNCFATIGEGGKRMIIADHGFLNEVNKISRTQWAAISILAHEIGHHIAGFSRRESSLDSELDADYWSGYVLQKLGASKESSVKCIMTFGTEADTNSHPSKYKRANTIKAGWEDAKNGKFDSDRCESCE